LAGADQPPDANDADDFDGRPDKTVHPIRWTPMVRRCGRKFPPRSASDDSSRKGKVMITADALTAARTAGVELGLAGATWFWRLPHHHGHRWRQGTAQTKDLALKAHLERIVRYGPHGLL